MSCSKKAENIKAVIHHFTRGEGILPDEINQMILIYSGCLKIGNRSLVFMTYNLPAFRGMRIKRLNYENRKQKQ
jgi:hypothetical protein